MNKSSPFARAHAIMAKIAAVMGDAAALAAIGPYKSRGKGRGKPFDKQRHGNKVGKYVPHQGKRECRRRVIQMAAAA